MIKFWIVHGSLKVSFFFSKHAVIRLAVCLLVVMLQIEQLLEKLVFLLLFLSQETAVGGFHGIEDPLPENF